MELDAEHILQNLELSKLCRKLAYTTLDSPDIGYEIEGPRHSALSSPHC